MIQLPQLTSENFNNWKFRVGALLDEKQLRITLEKEVTDYTEDKEKNEFEMKDARAKAIIIQCVTDKHLDIIKDAKTAKQMLKALQDVFERKSVFTKLTLKKRLLTLQLQKEQKLEDHFLKFDSIVRELESIDSKIDESDKWTPSITENTAESLKKSLVEKQTAKFQRIDNNTKQHKLDRARTVVNPIDKTLPRRPSVSFKKEQDESLMTIQADRGNAMVIINTEEYKQKIKMLLEPSTVVRETNRLVKVSSLLDDVKKQVTVTEALSPKLYGLPKIHKRDVPLRPIMNPIGTPTYLLPKHITTLLPSIHRWKTYLYSRFSALRGKYSGRYNSTQDQLLRSFYEQTDGVAMESPLSPVVANLFVEQFKSLAIETAVDKPTV
ncbi:hypothetical protein Trydic_g1748 [Trypoxylus dichotomus]